MSAAPVQVRGVSIRLGEFAVHDATMEVPAGDYFVLLGPTGAGKTVLLECIAGLHRPERGEVLVGGVRINELPPERRNLGYLPQDYALFPHLNVRDNIGFGMALRGRPPREIARKVEELAEMLSITHLLHRSPLRLSGGERQRVALARALAIGPQVLLLDEPLSALDEQTREGLCGELRRMHEALGTTTVHVSHNFEETLMVADRIGIIHQGRMQQVGAPEEIFRRPASEFVARFVRSDNILRGRAARRDGMLTVQVGEKEFRVRGGPEGEVLLTIRPEEIAVSRQRPTADAPNVVEGKVSRLVDRGPMMRVDIEGPVKLIALLPRPMFRESGLRPGDAVFATFDPAVAYVLPAA